MADNSVTVEFSSDTSQLNESLQQIADTMRDFQNQIGNGTQKSAALGKALAENLGSAALPIDDLTKLFDQIGSVSESNFNRAVVGAQSWQQAMLSITRGVETSLLQMVEKEVSAFLGGEIAKTDAAQTGAVTRVGISQAAGAASGAADAAEAKSSITGHAASAAAAVYDDVAQIPYVGWVLAPPAAAAAFVGVAAYSALVPSFAVGAWELNGDTLAQLHQGEMVVPATFAQGLRQSGLGGGAGGGDSYQVTINAVDQQSVKNLLQSNAGMIAQIMQKQVRNFSSSTQGM